ncbi:MAG: mannose-6-phosphate isomerase [Ruminococcaceae bacterium]|nr:mannose-6-phosphate isomerase [Oscillospiraceae bacterium]
MSIDLTKPIRLETSRAWRTYLGGKMISALHGEAGEDDHFPEEWLMSTVAARNSGREHIVEGISRVFGTDMTLGELVDRYPEDVLGTSHLQKHGACLGVLVKLLDSAERLTLQVHPTREAAKKLFNSEFGKTECWHIIGKREINGEAPCIYMGFREGVTYGEWKRCFDEQDIPAMLNCLHRVQVSVGDTFIIRGGVPHGIGAGCFLIEIQEPTDYTVRTERVTPSGLAVADFMCHQGLGFDRMFECFIYDGASLEDTLSRYRVTPISERFDGYTVEHIIYPEVTDMFALDKISVTEKATFGGNDSFCGIYVISGNGMLNGEHVCACDHYFIPASCKSFTVEASDGQPVVFIRCFGPTN